MNISVSPAGWMAEDLAEAITVEEFSKNANTLELLYSDYSRKRGKDLLNTLMDEYYNSSEAVKKEEGHIAMVFYKSLMVLSALLKLIKLRIN